MGIQADMGRVLATDVARQVGSLNPNVDAEFQVLGDRQVSCDEGSAQGHGYRGHQSP